MSDILPESQNRMDRYFDEPADDTVEEFRSHDVAHDDLRPWARYQYGKDYDRLLYSSAFRALGGVTQVVTSGEIGDFHNRLTHSLKVAQTGVRASSWILRNATATEKRHIATFGGLHPSVVRAACLAHDLGHPPFGHIGENALQEIAETPSAYIRGYPPSAGGLTDSFEGNAQSFRIVTRLAFRQVPENVEDEPALNLTRATLAALSKYPWSRHDVLGNQLKGGKKWGAYETEKDLLVWAFDGMCGVRETTRFGKPHTETRTVEGQLMDWSDDIAYAIHDIEDFYRAGLIPLHRLTRYKDVYQGFLEFAYAELERTGGLPHFSQDGGRTYEDRVVTRDEVDQVLQVYAGGVFSGVPWQQYDGSRKHRRGLHEYAARLIRCATSNLSVTDAGVVQPKDPDTYLVIEVLKQLTPYYVVHRPPLASAQLGQQRILEELVASVWRWAQVSGALKADDGELRSLPRRLVDFLDVAHSLQPAREVDGESPEQSERRLEDEKSQQLLRAIIDFVASLTDDQARTYHERLCLGSTASMLDPWLF